MTMLVSPPSNDLVTALLPASAVIVAALISAVITWAKDLNAAARRARALDEATKRIAFWEAWHKALSSLNEDDPTYQRTAIKEIEQISEAMTRVFRNTKPISEWGYSEYAEYRDSVSSVRRFLMAYKMFNPVSRMLRWIAYGSVIFYSAEVWQLSHDKPFFWIVPRSPHHYFWQSHPYLVPFEYLFLMGIPWVVFRWVATFREDRFAARWKIHERMYLESTGTLPPKN